MDGADSATVVALDQFDGAEQCRRIGKVRDLGQEPSHLDLGIGACLQLAVDLDDIVVIDQRGTVRPVRLNHADVFGLPDRFVGEAAGGAEFKPQALFAFVDRERLPQVSQQQRDEDLVVGDVEQRSFARALTDRCQRARVIALAVEAHPFDLHRQHIAAGRRRAASS